MFLMRSTFAKCLCTTLFIAIFLTPSSHVQAAPASQVEASEERPLSSSDPINHWNNGESGLQWAEIGFDDIGPSYYISLQQCWNAMGMDDRGRVYIGLTSDRRTGGEDFRLFRYHPGFEKRTLLSWRLLSVSRAHIGPSVG